MKRYNIDTIIGILRSNVEDNKIEKENIREFANKLFTNWDIGISQLSEAIRYVEWIKNIERKEK